MAQECSVCAEVKSTEQFPASPITQECTHAPTTCRPCITRAIETELSSKPWEKVGCPDCGATLGYHDVQKYADLETREKYDKLMILHTLQQDPDFIWHKVPWHAGVTCEEFDLTQSDSAASLPQGNRAVELAEARRHKRDNDASEATIKSTTKACPSCKSQIEKNGGW
ncbi:hypothetical protein A9Z42_0055890 [Trichoderma parareesei]|uniref:RING-type domain-containing protein n=1 Tax=Trichoderma parareesei TaxID=858221 RepID=A0A2H2ZJY1_TRIPA|nr:hypothetical protein A9Z42_0055890 [Trichoderma parareesei]